MKTRSLISILAGVFAISCVLAGMASAASGNGGGPQRVPVFVGFHQVPGPAEQALVRSHGGVIKYSYTLVPAIAASVPEPAIEGLRRNPNVTIVEPDIEVYAVDAELTNSWGVEHIGAGIVHASGNKGAGVRVAIIDTGIDYTHPDLDGNYGGGYDFVNGDSSPLDDNGHGTHVAGTVAAEDNDSGVVGVAPEADLYALKVLNASGSGSYSAVIAALQWAVSHGIQVTNNSYGSSGSPGSTVQAAFDNAAAAGIINVCAAGNSGNLAGTGDNVIYPARYTSCIAVAATDSSDTRGYFSSTGPDVELAAPGVSVRSTYPGGGYAYMSGTSMACPHVAGTATLVIAAGLGGVRTRLQQTADDLGAAGKDSLYGYGLVDADEAAAAGPGEPRVLTTIEVLPSVATLSPGESQQFTATGKDQYGDAIDPGAITWASLDESVGTIDRSGMFTGVGEGITVVGATGSGDVSGTAIVTVEGVLAPPSMHVATIAMSLKKTGPNVNGVATVTVMDVGGARVAGATVYGHWSGATSDSDVGTTDTLGRVALQSDKVRKPASGTTFTFTVHDVVKTGWTYAGGVSNNSISVP